RRPYSRCISPAQHVHPSVVREERLDRNRVRRSLLHSGHHIPPCDRNTSSVIFCRGPSLAGPNQGPEVGYGSLRELSERAIPFPSTLHHPLQLGLHTSRNRFHTMHAGHAGTPTHTAAQPPQGR